MPAFRSAFLTGRGSVVADEVSANVGHLERSGGLPRLVGSGIDWASVNVLGSVAEPASSVPSCVRIGLVVAGNDALTLLEGVC